MALKKILADYSERHDSEELARRLGIKYSTLMRKMNPEDPLGIHACQLVEFIEATQHTWKDPARRKQAERDFSLLDEIEFRLGRVFTEGIKSPKYDFSFHGLARLIKESSEATREISEACTDGKITPLEAENCIRELHNLVYVSMELIQELEKIEISGKSLDLRE
jgi:hypothetical protein